MDVTMQNLVVDSSTQSNRRREKRRLKKKAVENDGDEIGDHMDIDLEASDTMKDHKVANNESKGNFLKTDLTVQPLVQHPKMDASSMENIFEGISYIKKKKKKNKKKTIIEVEVQSMDQIKTDTVLIQNLTEGNATETSSIGKVSDGNSNIKQTKMKKKTNEVQIMNWIKAAAVLIQNLAEGNVTDPSSKENVSEQNLNKEKTESKKNKKKTTDKDEVQNMDQIKAAAVLIQNLAEGNVTNTSSMEKLQSMDQIKAAAVLIQTLAEGNMTAKRKGKRENDKAVEIEGETQCMNLDRSILNLHLSDINHGHKIDDKLITECAGKVYGICHSDHNMDNPSASSLNLVKDTQNPLDLLKHEALLLSSVSEIKPDTMSVENLPEANVTGKRKTKQKNKAAKIEDEIQTVNLAGPISDLHVSDVNHGGKVDDKLRTEFTDKEYGLCHNDPIMFNPSISSSNLVPGTENPLDLLKHEAVLLSGMEQVHVDTGLIENIAEANVIGEKKKRKSKKAKIKDEIQSTNLAGSILNLHLSDVNHGGKLDGKPSDKEYGLIQSGHNEDHPSISSSNLVQNTENPLKLLRHENAILLSSVVEVSSNQSSSGLVEEKCGPLINSIESRGKLFPSESSSVPTRRKLLILDLNGLLADIVRGPARLGGDAHISGRAIFRRPFYEDFLNFCFENFDVGIWSSRSKRIIDQVVDYLLGDLKYKLQFCWDMKHATQTGFKTLEDKHKPMVCKELKKIWENDYPNLRWKKGEYNESNTLLLDDSPYKALLNPPHTAIFPNSYHYRDKNDSSLGPGGDIRVYLQGLVKCENVQEYVEQHPFGQRAITEKTLSWGFYNEVLQKMSKRQANRAKAPVLTLS